MSALRQAVAFLTPVGGPAAVSPEALVWFPVVGTAVGLGLGGLWWGAAQAWPAAVAAGLVVAADLAFTGLLHVDGLADSADGLLPHLEPEQRLTVMHSPGVGAFAVAVTIATLLLRLVALASMAAAPLLLAGLWCASRSLMVLLAARLPYARAEGGLPSAFLGGSPQPAAVCGLLTGVILAGLWAPLPGLVAVVGASATAWAVGAFARRRIGGFTGDVLGAAGLLAETAGLVLAAAKW